MYRTKYLTNNLITPFVATNKNLSALDSVEDRLYSNFLTEQNGGLYFDKSLIIYGLGDLPTHFSFINMNLLINERYQSMIPNCRFFACDVFGNQFGFLKQEVCFLNIEIGEYEIIARNFEEWLTVLKENLDYYTGQSLLLKWEKIFGSISSDERLCAKKPFVIGGDYDVKNLYSMNLVRLIEYNSDLAKQIHDMPDGSIIDIKVVD